MRRGEGRGKEGRGRERGRAERGGEEGGEERGEGKGRREERSGRGDKCVAGRVNVAGCGRPGVLTEEVEGKVGSAVVETALAVTRDNTCAAAVKDTVIMSMHRHTHTPPSCGVPCCTWSRAALLLADTKDDTFPFGCWLQENKTTTTVEVTQHWL